MGPGLDFEFDPPFGRYSSFDIIFFITVTFKISRQNSNRHFSLIVGVAEVECYGIYYLRPT